ncbi:MULTISPECIES: hypothetical protein [Zoogloea]|jgi:hypothetical protein|uniref:Uncharacterized protein n=1 Tax=Zoogloea oryzae TaxID=310767 RepID=A0ABQ6FDC8_9RHOO|nr:MULTISPECIES: hypothetical protein [Zoogloea]GLT23237.1 hypothetical protein GCM10007933_27000 [Zoogloea oryzae]
MDSFYDRLDFDDAIEIEQLSRLMYEVRVARDNLLAQLGAGTPEQALAAIRSGNLPEHPGYEQYLTTRLLTDLHANVRARLAERTQAANR